MDTPTCRAPLYLFGHFPSRRSLFRVPLVILAFLVLSFSGCVTKTRFLPHPPGSVPLPENAGLWLEGKLRYKNGSENYSASFRLESEGDFARLLVTHPAAGTLAEVLVMGEKTRLFYPAESLAVLGEGVRFSRRGEPFRLSADQFRGIFLGVTPRLDRAQELARQALLEREETEKAGETEAGASEPSAMDQRALEGGGISGEGLASDGGSAGVGSVASDGPASDHVPPLAVEFVGSLEVTGRRLPKKIRLRFARAEVLFVSLRGEFGTFEGLGPRPLPEGTRLLLD